jgi:hypothetical protein
MQRNAATLVAVAAAIVLFGVAPSARAQFNSVAPPFAKLTGGYLWGSLGYREVAHPERLYVGARRPVLRGAFAALLGPFGGQPDTIVSLDSVRTSVEWVEGKASVPGATRMDTVRTVHAVRSHHTLPGRDGWVSLAVGYTYSGAYRVDIRDETGTLASTFPVGGIYASVLFGPFPVWHVSKSAFWYGTLGASALALDKANGKLDSTLVRFDTERTLAPEIGFLTGWRVHRGVRVIGGISMQYIRWSSMRYRAPSELPLSDAIMQRLPEGLRLSAVHLNLGVSFDASDLFGK